MIIIGITGGSGAGKTTVAKIIAKRLEKGNVVFVSQDWYYKDQTHLSVEDRVKLNLDHPNAFEEDNHHRIQACRHTGRDTDFDHTQVGIDDRHQNICGCGTGYSSDQKDRKGYPRTEQHL